MQQLLLKTLQTIDDWQNKKYLVAISGGVDSVVLAHLFKTAGLSFELAHCNFKLRGAESDADQAFVESFAQKLNIPVHIKVCDISKDTGNIQILARNKRYEWFDQLSKKRHFDYIVTGHNLNDKMETFFINLMRGTGLNGLLSIRNTGKILRPLLEISRNSILAYARQNDLKWREDSSNASDKYLRNFIRHHIIPQFYKKEPGFDNRFLTTIKHLEQNYEAVQEWFQMHYNNLVEENNDHYRLDLKKFKDLNLKDLFLHYWLSAYGFTDSKEIFKLIHTQTGRRMFSDKYVLYKHGEYLILTRPRNTDDTVYKIPVKTTKIEKPVSLELNIKPLPDDDKKYLSADADEAYIDFDKLNKELTLRKIKPGDYFYPLGMTGKKKINDYLKDKKISVFEKENIYLLCNRNDIVWVVGFQVDNRYKITDKTKKVLHIKQFKTKTI